MNMNQVNEIIEGAPKGANIVCEWKRPCKIYKRGEQADIEKHVRTVGRVGIDYDEMQEVKQGRAEGSLPAENAGLPAWQKWVVFPFLLAHKTKGTKYIRLYKGTSKTVKPFVKWYKNGVEVPYSVVEPYLTSGERKEKTGACFSVKVESLLKVWVVEN